MYNIEINDENFKHIFLDKTPFIDVRAPVEFSQGSLPGAVNLPILNDEERALIGTIYKNQGQAAAVQRGFELISGSVKQERLKQWQHFIHENPQTILYCFRGGKRSQITQQWLKEVGVDRPLILGGYKKARNFLIQNLEVFSREQEVLSLTGPTGSGKTVLLKEIQSVYPILDLENLANHRGSAFGYLNSPQPSQVDFENLLSVEIIKLEKTKLKKIKPLIEDESRLIGRVQLPEKFFDCLRRASVIWIDEPLDRRIENIFKEYILDTPIGVIASLCQDQNIDKNIEQDKGEAINTFARYKKAAMAIQKKLGGLRAQEILADIIKSENDFVNKNELIHNKIWIEKLLKYYYDPLYLGSLDRRNVKVNFKGNAAEIKNFLLG